MQENCPFCLSNELLKSDIIAENEMAFLTKSYKFPECFLLIPKQHATSLIDLPDMWWQYFKEIMTSAHPLPLDYNLSLNYGTAAGQTIRHLHFWIVPRHSDENASGKGLVTLIQAVNQGN